MRYSLVLKENGESRRFNTNRWEDICAISRFAGYGQALDDYGKELRRLKSDRGKLAEIHFQLDPKVNNITIFNNNKFMEKDSTAFGAAV